MRVPSIAIAVICSLITLTGCGGTGSSSSTPATSGSSGGGGGSSAGSGSGSGTNSGTGGSGSGGSSGSGSGSPGAGGASSPAALAFVAAGPSQLSGTNQFYGISVDASGKVSTTPGSPYTVGLSSGGPMTAVAGSNNLLFVTGHYSSDTNAINITSFRSDANGRLTQLTSTAADGALWLALDASGKYLYASAMADPTHQGFSAPTVYGFTVDQSSGALAPVPGSPWSLNYDGSQGEMNTIAVSPDGSNLCVGLVLFRNSEAIECYSRRGDGTIDAANFHAITHSTLPQRFTFNLDGTHLLSVNADRNSVQSSPLPGSTGSSEVSSGGTFPHGFVLHPRGHWLAVTNESSASVSITEVGAQGSLAPTGTVAPAGTGAFEVSFSHSGDYLFVTANEGTFVFSFNANTGALTPLNAGNPAPGTGNVAGF